MNKGIEANGIPKHYNVPQQMSSNDPGMPPTHLEGYGQMLLESQIQTEEDQLRDRIRALIPGEVLVLRGDRDNSLTPRSGHDLNEGLMQQHLSCLLVPHQHFQGRSQV